MYYLSYTRFILVYSEIPNLPLRFPEEKAKCLNTLFVAFSTHVKSNNFPSLRNVVSYPLARHIVVPNQVNYDVILVIDESHTTQKVEGANNEQAHLFNLPECVNWLTFEVISLWLVVHFEQRRFDAISELELNSIQVGNVFVDDFSKFDDFAIVLCQLLQLLFAWEFLIDWKVRITEYLHSGQDWIIELRLNNHQTFLRFNELLVLTGLSCLKLFEILFNLFGDSLHSF